MYQVGTNKLVPLTGRQKEWRMNFLATVSQYLTLMSDLDENLSGFLTTFPVCVAGVTGTKWGHRELGSSCLCRGLGVVKKRKL